MTFYANYSKDGYNLETGEYDPEFDQCTMYYGDLDTDDKDLDSVLYTEDELDTEE